MEVLYYRQYDFIVMLGVGVIDYGSRMIFCVAFSYGVSIFKIYVPAMSMFFRLILQKNLLKFKG